MSQGKRLQQFFSSLNKKLPRQAFRGQALTIFGMVLVGGVAFGLGRWMGIGSAIAQPGVSTPLPSEQADALYGKEYPGRVVAYIYGNEPIYRVDLAEYLISRFGQQRIEFLVNRKIVERACRAKGIIVTDQEVELQFRSELAALGPHMTAQMFQDQVLKRYNKTTFEWKEDVIRPKLALSKLVRPEVQLTDAEMKKGFEMRYGPKVQCRIAVYQSKADATRAWERITSSGNIAAAFMDEAKKQFEPALASQGGTVPPIFKHFGDPQIEKEAFSMKPGEISQVIGMPAPNNSALILFCEKHIAADNTKTYENEFPTLHKEIFEVKLAEKIQEKVVLLRKEAEPRYLLAKQPSIDEVVRDTREELNDQQQPMFKGVTVSQPSQR